MTHRPMTHWMERSYLLLIVGTLMASAGWAAAEGPPDHPHHPHQPPREAFEACNGLSAGEACSVTFDGRTLEGTCRTRPDGNGPLVCAPKGFLRGGPPPEALAACTNLAAGASCSVTLHGHTLEGTCRSGPDGTGPLACFPNAPPPHPRRP